MANKSFVLREWSPLVPILRLNFNVMPLCARIMDMLPFLLFVESAEIIGSMFEKLLEVDA